VSNIIGTRLGYETESGEIASVDSVAAGYGKVTAVEHLRTTLGIPRERVIYVGDGSSDLHVMLHVNRGEGLTIAVSQARQITEIARRTVLSDDALAVFVPLLEEVARFDPPRIRSWFDTHGLVIQEWDRVRTDWVNIRASSDGAEPALFAVA
jgi:predicted HAD superfamily phosphohydrolase